MVRHQSIPGAGTADLPVWLFVSYGGGHVKALLPVALRVRELGIARPVYLALTTAAAQVRNSGLSTLGFLDFLRPDDARARAKGEELVAQMAIPAVDHQESVAYLGLSYAEMEDRLGQDVAAERWLQYGRQALLPFGVLQRILIACRPALVIATNSPRAEQAAIEVAGALGVPSACLVDLLGIWERDLLARPDYASALCVLNEDVRGSLLAAGRAAADVHVTGNPAFDGVNDPAVIAAGKRYRQQLGWGGLHVCMYASSPEPVRIPGLAGTGDPTFPRRVEECLVRAAQDNPALALWIRRHPSEAGTVDAQRACHPRIRESLQHMPLHACLHGSDEVIVTVSTVGVEASLAGKPVTQVRGSILDPLSPYLAMGVASREVNLDQLGVLYRSSSPQIGRVAASCTLVAPGNATGRVVKVLLALQERNRAP